MCNAGCPRDAGTILILILILLPRLGVRRHVCLSSSRPYCTCWSPRSLLQGGFHPSAFLPAVARADSDVSASACISCGQCASVCPVGAISERPQWRQVLELLESKRKVRSTFEFAGFG